MSRELDQKKAVRVLHVYRTYFPETQGGLEEAIKQICIASQSFDVESRVLTLANVKSVEWLHRDEAVVVRVPLQIEPASCSMGIELFREYRQLSEWADVIHLHYPWPFVDVVHLFSGTRKPVLVTYHSDIVRQRLLNKLYSPLRSLFFSKVNHVVATSPNYLQSSDLLSRLKKPKSVIPLALCESSYGPATERALSKVEQEYGNSFFLFVGVLRYYKGLHYLVKAAAETRLPVVIAGKGPEMERLKALVQELGASSVRLIGYVDDDIKQALYKKCQAVVFPSCKRSEAFGVTLLEGMMNKRPLISCDIGTGTSYVNQHEETGLVIPPEDPEALAQAMRKLNGNADLVADYGNAAYERFKLYFSTEKLGESYSKLYRSLAVKFVSDFGLSWDQ